jgi:NCS1 family nucleobase:cation symporter-1
MQLTLISSAAITTQHLIGFLCYFVFYVPFIWVVRPHQLKRFLYPGFVLVLGVMFGLLIWAVRSNNGSIGTLISSNPIVLSTSDKSFRIAQCIITIIGTWGGASERFSDWSRFAHSRQSPTLAMCLGMPLGVTFAAAIGALVTSATYQSTGILQWNPLVLLSSVQVASYTPAVRAGTFFAGFSLLACQMIVNLCNNTVGWGMDMAGAFRELFRILISSLKQRLTMTQQDISPGSGRQCSRFVW